MESSRQLEPTIAALRGAYEAFNRGDIDAALQPLDAQIEWTEPLEFPGGGTYHGHDGVKRYLTQSRAAWAERIEPTGAIHQGWQPHCCVCSCASSTEGQ
jgi:ketosteroid isomerase-like protein